VRILVGDKDWFFLNEAVAGLHNALNGINGLTNGGAGYIRILPGYTHDTIDDSPDAKHWPAEMMDLLRAHHTLPIVR
jgi:hypothetical protein